MGSETDVRIAAAFDHIKKMHRICANAGREFHVIVVPLHGIYDGSEGFQQSKTDFIAMLDSAGIGFTDWTTCLPDSNREALVFPLDHHLNESGQEFFAPVLTQTILNKYSQNTPRETPLPYRIAKK